MSFIPYLFVGVGETGAYFTLRETYLHVWYIGSSANKEVRSFHHFNLSQDADEAFEKAKAYADANAIRLKTSREELDIEMRNIKRMKAEEIAEREARMRQAEAEALAYKIERHQAAMRMIEEGKYPIGRYRDSAFTEAPVRYINWLIGAKGEFEEGTIIKALAEAVAERCAHLLLPVADKNKTYGEVGKRVDFEATVVAKYAFDGYYGVTYIVNTVTPNGECIVYKGGSFAPEVGEKVKAKATVKEHAEYRGQMQTVVQRVKL